MRFWLLLPLLIASLSCQAADKPTPPNGQQVLQIFFENANAPLKDEPFCQINDWTGDIKEGDDPSDPKYRIKTLGEYIAKQKGETTEMWRENDDAEFWRASILTSCDPELYHEAPLIDSDETIKADYWYCSVIFRDSMKDDPWVSQTSVTLFIKPDLSGVVPGTLRCLD